MQNHTMTRHAKVSTVRVDLRGLPQHQDRWSAPSQRYHTYRVAVVRGRKKLKTSPLPSWQCPCRSCAGSVNAFT